MLCTVCIVCIHSGPILMGHTVLSIHHLLCTHRFIRLITNKRWAWAISTCIDSLMGSNMEMGNRELCLLCIYYSMLSCCCVWPSGSISPNRQLGGGENSREPLKAITFIPLDYLLRYIT